MTALIREKGWMGDSFFRRLLHVADDYGRFDARPSYVRAKCYPTLLEMVRDADVQRLLAACETVRLIRVYTADSKAVGEILNFKQQVRAEKSKFPEFSGESEDDAQQVHSKCVADAKPLRTKAKALAEGVVVSEGATPKPPQAGDAVGIFWKALPQTARDRSSRKQCEAAWIRQKCGPIAAEVMAGLESWKKSAIWTKDGGQFILGAHRWLSAEKWREAPAKEEQSKKNPKANSPDISSPDWVAPDLTPEQIAAIEGGGEVSDG